MHDTFTITMLVILAILSGAAGCLATHRLGQPNRSQRVRAWVAALLGLITIASAGLFVYLWTVVHKQWQPLTAHVDGLVLIATLFAATILFVHIRKNMFGLTAFALPILTLIYAWSVCAAKWTYRPFNIDTLHPVWKAVHLSGVYLGTLSVTIAAVAAAMYLYVQHRLKRKDDLQNFGNLPSLERLENLIIRCCTLGFALFTLGLISGAVLIFSEGDEPITTGYWIKIAIATGAWVLYALLMNVRYTATFRGARAAWLSIIGFIMLIGVYGLVNVLPQGGV